jgi:hypothetical protein
MLGRQRRLKYKLSKKDIKQNRRKKEEGDIRMSEE